MTPESLRPRYLLVYIAGAGHCGSTLLNLLLNGHSRVLGLSEVSTLPDHIRRRDELLEQPFWRNVARRYEESTGLSFPDLETAGPPALRILSSGDRKVEEWARPNRGLLDCIARESGASALVDASKSWQRLTMLQRSCDFDLRVIHLIRDGRAVYNSYRRKYRRGLFTLTKWPKFTLSALLLKRSFSTANWLDLRYEALASDPENSLAKVCDFLSLDFEPAMLRYREQENLGLGGNRMARRSERPIRLDERWRTELRGAPRLAFGLFFGWLNRLLGYK